MNELKENAELAVLICHDVGFVVDAEREEVTGDVLAVVSITVRMQPGQMGMVPWAKLIKETVQSL